MNTRPSIVLLLLLLGSLVNPVCAQPLPGQAATDQEIAATIDQATRDLQAEVAETRRGGAMLLGKYPEEPAARQALLRALEDPAAAVRRAAVVSLAENVASLSHKEASQLLGALMDKDPEVRLGVAAWLPQLLIRAIQIPGQQGGLLPISQAQRGPVEKALMAALQDSQPLVRLKGVEALRFLRWSLPESPLLPLLSDQEPEVRLLAYPVLANILKPMEFVQAALAVFPDPDPRVRLALAESLLSRPSLESGPLLDLLAGDPELAVRQTALAGLFILFPGPELAPELREALMAPEVDRAFTARFMNALRGLDPPMAGPLAQSLLEAEAAHVRGQAAGLWLRSLDGIVPAGQFLAFLQDPSPEVRQQALQFAAIRPEQIDPAVYRQLPELPHLDVRLRAIGLGQFLPAAEKNRLHLRLLMDTEASVRMAALKEIARQQPANWPQLFKASLRDPSPEVRQAAALALLESLGPRGRELAAQFLSEFPDQAISPFLRERLQTTP